MIIIMSQLLNLICPRAWVLIWYGFSQFGRAIDECHDSSLVEQYYIARQFNFIHNMQKQHGFKIKTIYLDTDIFTHGHDRQGQRLIVPLIRSLTQKKNREYKKGREERHEKSIKNIDRQKYEYTLYSPQDRGLFTENYNLFEHFQDADDDLFKAHIKKTALNRKKDCQTERKPHFIRYNHAHSHSIDEKPQDPQFFFQKCNEQVVKADVPKQAQNESAPLQEKVNVNPYTKHQYIYMRNRQLDEISRMKRSAKLTRMNSITKSYRVATINLTPPSKRAHSFKIAIPSIHNKSKHSPFSNASLLRSSKKQAEIKPWEWMGPEQSKQYLI